ncbi:MAG: serine/threonine-protein kinase [Planctomycetaceae bacterium]
MALSAISNCPICGNIRSGDAVRGGCPYCLLELALESSEHRAVSSLSGEFAAETEESAQQLIRMGILPKFGNYELISEIARGGMGVVYRAWQKSLNRTVAVKLILAGQLATRESLQRFRLEAEAAARLHHPGIVPIYEIGEFETQHFFSMELIDGVSLAECLNEFVVIEHASPAVVREQELCIAEMISRVARALEFAHQHGVLHRDLKPSNILVDQEGLPHLTDFGLAKLTGRETSGLTLSHAVLGTPGYLAPEQAAGKHDVTTAADVYGLGATLYELLAGRPPFVGANALETMTMAMQQDPAPPRKLNPAIHRDLDTIALRCLEKQPERRYPSAGIVADELERFIRREPIVARPISQVERLWRWCQRHPGVSLLAVALLMAICVGSGAAFSQWRRAVQANVSLRENVQHLQWDLIDDMLLVDDSSRALAKVARLIRNQPADWKAAMLSMSIVERHRFPLAALPPIRHPDGAELNVARLSPDGSKIVTASIDGSARVWSSATGDLLLPPLLHTGSVSWAEFSPDSRVLATCSEDATHRLWDVATGQPVGDPTGHEEPVRRVHFSPDGKLLLARTARAVAVYDMADGSLKLSPTLIEGEVVEARFVAGGDCIFTAIRAGNNSQVEVRNLSTGKSQLLIKAPLADADISADLKRVAIVNGERCTVRDASSGDIISRFASPNGRMVEVRLSPDGEKVAVVGFDHWVRILSAVSGTPITSELSHDYLVNGLSFVGTGDRLATWGDDATLKLWDSTTGDLHAQPMKHPDRVQYAETGMIDEQEVFLTTISHLKFGIPLNGGRTGAAQLWRVHPVREPDDRSRGDHYGHNGCAMSRDGTLIALGTNTNEIWVMRTDTGETVCGPLKVHGGPWGVLFTPDARRLITTTASGQVAIWSIPSGTLLFEPRQLPTSFQPAEISPDGNDFATGSTDGFLRVWDSATGETIWEQQQGAEINSVGFSPNGRLVASAGENRITNVWDARSGELLQSLTGHQNEVTRINFSPDSSQLVTASYDFSARVWDLNSGQQVLTLPHQGELLDAGFSPDGRHIATGSRDRTAMIWDAATGKPCNRPLIHRQTVRHVAFTADSQRLLTVCQHGPRIWDVETGHPLTVRLSHSVHAGDGFQSSPFDAQLTPDGQAFFISANCRKALLWHVPTPPSEIPVWFPQFLEAIAGQRFRAENDTPESVPPDKFLDFDLKLRGSQNVDFYTTWCQEWLKRK